MHAPHLRPLARALLEQDLFAIDGWPSPHATDEDAARELQREFAAHDCPLSTSCQIQHRDLRTWLVHDGARWYVVRADHGHAVVTRQRVPGVSHVIASTEALAHRGPVRLRQFGFCEIAALRKHLLEHPQRLMVNLGAGRWHVPGWKILDYQGIWYHYPPFFVDYPHDLTSPQPLPFTDGSVHRFYSEHVFEHFPDAVDAHVFREMRRCLAPDGGARIVVPDGELIWRKFGERDERFFGRWMRTRDASLTEAFLILVGHPRHPFDEDDVARRHASLPRAEFLDQCTADLAFDPERAGEHVNWFDRAKLGRMLRDAGFSRVAFGEGQQSRFPQMRGPGFDKRAWYSLHVDVEP